MKQLIFLTTTTVTALVSLSFLPNPFLAAQLLTDHHENQTSVLISDTPQETVTEQKVVTRAELAKILVDQMQLEQRPNAAKPDVSVPDVPQSHPAYQAIQVAIKTGVMNSYRDGMFFPNQTINRAEGFAIFAQADGLFPLYFPFTAEGILARYPDALEIPNWARKGVARALRNGFVNVDPLTNQIYPLNPMTQADIDYALRQYRVLRRRS